MNVLWIQVFPVTEASAFEPGCSKRRTGTDGVLKLERCETKCRVEDFLDEIVVEVSLKVLLGRILCTVASFVQAVHWTLD